jgi:ArsR family transcriptional regulator
MEETPYGQSGSSVASIAVEDMMQLRQKVVEDLAEVFGVLSHPTRIRILALLHLREHDVSELRQQLGTSAANVSQHLAILRARHLVKVRREGTRVFYSTGDPRLAALINCALDILDEDMSLTGEIRQAIQQVRLQP